VNTTDLNIEVTANTAQAPQLQGSLDGSAELTLWAKVAMNRIDSYQAKEPKTDKTVSFQVLPSVLTMAGKPIARSHSGYINSNSLDNVGRKVEQTAPLWWTLSRDQLLAVEQARNGRAADFAAKLAVAFRDGANAWTWEFDLSYRIPASDWVDVLSAQSLIKKLHVAIRLGPATDLSTNAHLRNEVTRAQRLYHTGDYSGCVAAVRDLWDPIVKEVEPSGRWDRLFESRLPSEVGALLKTYAAALRAIVNKGHHRGVTGPSGLAALYEFTQRDAEFVLETTLAFLRYIGRLATE